MKKRPLFILVNLLFVTILTNAQEIDTLQQKVNLAIKEKFPRTRILNFEYGTSLGRNFNSELFDDRFQEGQIKRQRNFNATLNFPIYKKKGWRLGGTATYQFNEFEFDNLEKISTVNIFEQDGIVNFHRFSFALSSTYFSRLFDIPVIYNASAIVDGNDKGIERLKGLVGLSFILKKNRRTTLSLGAIVFIDPTTQIPFFPTFSYSHQFKNSKWELDFILPQRLLLRRLVGDNGRISLGSTFGGNGFYVNVSDPVFASVYEYSQLEIESGLIYEYKINNYLIGTLRGGLKNFISNRLTQKGEPNSDFIYKNEQDATGYFQIGISINPFSGISGNN